MNRLTNPIIWLYRIRHRCGYGVHSPYAFRFITDVIYEKTPYYAYSELAKNLSLKDRFRIRRILQLVFRISNWRQPNSILCLTTSDNVIRYLREGCKMAIITTTIPKEKIDLLWLDEPNNEVLTHLHVYSVLLLDNLNKNKDWFMSLPSVVTFDLYDIGIAFFDTKYNKQHYIVNF